MTATPLLRRSAIRFLNRKGIDFDIRSEWVIFSHVAVSGETRLLDVVIIDISRSVACGDGFMILAPDLITFKSSRDAVFAASVLNLLRLLGGEAGKFTVIGRTLIFALAAIVPKDAAAPEHVEIALRCAVDAVTQFHAAVVEAGNMGKEAVKTAADDVDWDLGDDWDYSGYSAPA